MLAGVGEGVGEAADDDVADGVALVETLGDGVLDGEPAEDPPADGVVGVEAQAAASTAITIAPSPDRIPEPTPL